MAEMARIDRWDVRAYRVPTDHPEADGTLAWQSTTLIEVEVEAGGQAGLGYTYSDSAIMPLIRDVLGPCDEGRDVFDIPALWAAMVAKVRNLGRGGLCSTAISALDVALWDLKARLVGLPLAKLLGMAREAVPVYGSGGFTSYELNTLCAQMGGWADAG